ncbi:MAG: hypothetical protein WC508_00140 [Patescibacteria group bacterium]
MFERHQKQFRAEPQGAETDSLKDIEEIEEGETSETEDISVPKSEAQEPRQESVETVAELLVSWAKDYEEVQDEGAKRELAYKILKMEMALGTAKLSADKVKIRKAENGTLGLFDPESGEIAITEEGLELPPQHFADVFVHESAHAGKLTGHSIMDEGMAEWFTIHRLPNAMQGIYVQERQRAINTFGADAMAKAAEKYDYHRPTRLAELYLETELEDRWNLGLKRKVSAKSGKEDKTLAKAAAGELKLVDNLFKKGVPDLWHSLKEVDSDFFQAVGLKILKRLNKQEA